MANEGLDWISTHWPLIHDPAQFLVRYAPAVRRYLEVLVHHGADAEDIAQEFMLAVVKHRFARATPDRGRFRDYLKRAVRNAVNTFYRRRSIPVVAEDVLRQIAEAAPGAEETWLREWRQCLLDRAWRDLDHLEHDTAGSWCATILRLALEHSNESSEELCQRLRARTGANLQAPALRKQLSRARRAFAKFLIEEVQRTLKTDTRDALEEELIEVGLMPYVAPYWSARAD